MDPATLNFQVVVIGAGPAGLAAACRAAEQRLDVALVDESPWLGGQIWRGQQPRPTLSQARLWLDRFHRSGAKLLDRTAVIGAPRAGVLLVERGGVRQLTYEKLIVATGARELFLPFPGWTLPGVMGAGGLLNLAKAGWPVRGKRVLVAGSGPLLLAAADGLRKYGAKIVAIAEQAPSSAVYGFARQLIALPAKFFQAIQIKSRVWNVPYLTGHWPIRAEGNDQVASVTLTDSNNAKSFPCDLLACGFGLVPNVELPLLLGCKLDEQGVVMVNEYQESNVANVYCAGELTGIAGMDCALVEGQIAGLAASGELHQSQSLFQERSRWHRFRNALARAFALRDELKNLVSDEETLLCRCEDVALARVKACASSREAKLQLRCGMGACQGRVCGAAAKFLFGWKGDNLRPPLLPTLVRNLVTKSDSD